jgi:hypothetical protein
MDADDARTQAAEAGVALDPAAAEAVAALVERVEAGGRALEAELDLEGVEPFVP